MLKKGETPEFVGQCVFFMAYDVNVHKKTGRILLTGDLCDEYYFMDIDGTLVRIFLSIIIFACFFFFRCCSCFIS